MHFFTATIASLLLWLGLGAAHTMPYVRRGDMTAPAKRMEAGMPGQADPVGEAAAAATGAGGSGGGAAAQPAMDATCAQGSILAQGIALNIADQQQELSTVNSLATILGSNPVDMAAYSAARTNLLRFVNNGIAIREMNQLITPAGNGATAGVATVANAQLTELGLASNLTETGADNVAGNMAIVKMLQMDFMGGIQQNMKNMAAAMSGCQGADSPPAAPAAPTAAATAGKVSGQEAHAKPRALKFSAKVGVQNERPYLSTTST